MMNKEMKQILAAAKEDGWVLEPEAKRLFRLAGLSVPNFAWCKNREECLAQAGKIGYPLAAKVVSPDIVHKSDSGGVVVNIQNAKELENVFERFSKASRFAGVLIEEMVSGLELIIGSKNDIQFGPVILLGIGGTGVEIYRDSVIRMPPLQEKDVVGMINSLQAHKLFDGYRGDAPVNRRDLTKLLVSFSALVLELGNVVASIDLNPVFCNAEKCVIADARIMLK
jgi:hypothetical protein